jgi:cytochrome P450
MGTSEGGMESETNDPRRVGDGISSERLRALRREQPVFRLREGAWFLARRAEILTCLHEVTTFVADLAPISGLASYRDLSREQLFLSEIEEPRHGKIRRIYNSSFAKHRLGDLGEYLEQVCHRLLDRLLAAGDASVDLHVGYALPIPSLAMCRLMGLPPETAEKFAEWSFEGTLMQRRPSPGADPAGPPIQQFFAAELARRRADSGSVHRDVLQALIDADLDGEPLSELEIVTQLQFMVMAGVHTTRTLMTHLLHRLLIDPALFATLAEQRELVPNYIEESLRHDSPVQVTARRCARAAELGGEKIAAGEWVQVGLGSANRDESYIDRPDEFRLDRAAPRDHLAFGAGSHICPGAALARLEAETCMRVLLDRVAAMRPVEGAEYPPLPSGLSELPIPAYLTPKTQQPSGAR